MNFRVLWDLEVVVHGESLRFAGGRQRAMPTVLLPPASEVVTRRSSD